MIAPAGKGQSDLRAALRLHLGKLPENAPLRGVIASDPIQKLVDLFDKADATAIKEQRTYRRLGRMALWATMAGTVVGALVLLPIDRWTTGWPRLVIQGLQAVALTLSLVATLWVGWRQSVGRWLRARAVAEGLRGDAFRAIVQAGADARDLLVPALACFKDAHLDWQLAYYTRRGAQHRRSAGNTAPYKLLGYLILAVAVVVGAVGFLNLVANFRLGVAADQDRGAVVSLGALGALAARPRRHGDEHPGVCQRLLLHGPGRPARRALRAGGRAAGGDQA